MKNCKNTHEVRWDGVDGEHHSVWCDYETACALFEALKGCPVVDTVSQAFVPPHKR